MEKRLFRTAFFCLEGQEATHEAQARHDDGEAAFLVTDPGKLGKPAPHRGNGGYYQSPGSPLTD
jgi:hypothetical protein